MSGWITERLTAATASSQRSWCVHKPMFSLNIPVFLISQGWLRLNCMTTIFCTVRLNLKGPDQNCLEKYKEQVQFLDLSFLREICSSSLFMRWSKKTSTFTKIWLLSAMGKSLIVIQSCVKWPHSSNGCLSSPTVVGTDGSTTHECTRTFSIRVLQLQPPTRVFIEAQVYRL